MVLTLGISNRRENPLIRDMAMIMRCTMYGALHDVKRDANGERAPD
ncbi:hypothetical protein [Thalassospira alkalitolerans]